MTIFTPNIVISKSYEFINKFMGGAKLSDISSDAINDSLVFLNKQNRYVYSLEHSFNFGQSDMGITLRIVDTDGNFENEFLNETFYEKLMATKIDDYLKSNLPGREFNNYFASIIGSNIKLYVTYGIGDNLNDWSDPIVCTLVTANIDVANNGLRKYTYQFQPVGNTLFTAPPEKDPNDPNTNDYFSLGIANISINSELKLDDPTDATMNVKNILTKFCSKISHTPSDNVVIVLPDFDEKYSLWCRENTFSGIDGVSKGYSKLFKSIRGEFIAGQTVLNAINLNLTRAKTSFVDYVNEQEKKSLDRVKQDAKKRYEAAKSPRTGKNAIERSKELKQINKEITQLNESLQRDTAPRYADVNSKRKEELDRLEKRKKDLELDRETGKITSKDKEVENAYQDTLDTTDAEDAQRRYGSFVKKSLTNLINKIPTSVSTKEVKTPNSFILTMLAQADGQGKEGELKIPDPRAAILQAFEGINSILFDDNIVPAMAYETNMRFLKLFKEAGIIANDQIPCFIVGDRELILHYLYGNKYTKNLQDLNYSMSPKDPLASIITNKSYGDKLKKLILRNKTNSSFSESLSVDELSLDNNVTKESLLEYEKYSRGLDYPIFINNFRNSNVLSYSLKNSQNYFSINSDAVRDNRLKYLYKTFDDKKKNEMLKKFGIDPIGKTPIQIARDFYDKGLQQLEGDADLAQKKIPVEEIPILEGTDSTPGQSKWDKVSKQTISDLQTSLNSKESVESRYLEPKLGGLVLNNSNEPVSYLNLAIQSEIKSFAGNTINKADLAALSELIILINQSDNESDDTTLSIVPGLTMPGTGFILSRIHEYSKRMATEVSIKTLPFFYLSNLYDINKKCAFFSKRNQFMGKTNPVVTFDFFSGQYLITGFRHVITTSECYSEFLLTKFGTSDDITVTRKLKSADKIKAEAQAKAEKEAIDQAVNKIDTKR